MNDWEAALEELETATSALQRIDIEDDTQLAEWVERRGAALERIERLNGTIPTGALERLEEALRGGEAALHRFRIWREVTRAEKQQLETGAQFLRSVQGPAPRSRLHVRG